MSKSNPKECVVCALNPILCPGRLLGFVPVISTCPHVEKTATSQIFRKAKAQKYLQVLWMFVMAASSVGYIWLVARTQSGIAQRLTEMINCLNNTSVVVFTIRHVDILLIELNGLACIVNNRQLYNLDKLVTNSIIKFVRGFSIIMITICYSVYATLFVYVLNDGFEWNMEKMLYVTGISAGGLCTATAYIQLWSKMFLIMDIHKTSFAQIKKALQKSLLLTPGELEDCLEKAIRVQMAMVRNYKECAQFWNPSMVYSQVFGCGILIVGFYVMITTTLQSRSDGSFGIQVQLHTAFLIMAMISIHGSHDWLENVVSTVLCAVYIKLEFTRILNQLGVVLDGYPRT